MADHVNGEQEDDGGMGRLLRERLPRHPAPPVLRAAVVEALMPERPRQPWWALWLPPAFSAVATAMIMLLFLAPSLPSAPGADPVHLVTRADRKSTRLNSSHGYISY